MKSEKVISHLNKILAMNWLPLINPASECTKLDSRY